MYQKQITEKEAGQRFDKYLHRLLPQAGTGFLYKMLRKKNITLNGKKADGTEKINAGDSVSLFFSEETLQKFMGSGDENESDRRASYDAAYEKYRDISVLYENQHILLADKPAGVLSQKAEVSDLSLNEWLIGYLLASGFQSEQELAAFKPSVCNRLDRNTSGIVLCAKSLQGAQLLGELLQSRSLHKYYQAFVKGVVREECLIEGYLVKDEAHNKVAVRRTGGGDDREAYIKTSYKPIQVYEDKTLLEVELMTGKPHQIRAHLASIGHPLLGDYKYGDRAWNDFYKKKYHVKAQLLHAYKVVFPKLEAPFGDISERTFCAQMPVAFSTVSHGEKFVKKAFMEK
jgi:23S rRNA pseudouridine955/2504/2580 synthase